MSNLSSQFVTCPKCNGVGKTAANLVCNECGGISLGTFIKNDFLYWGYDITPAKIIVRQSGIIFDRTINVISLLAGLGGVIGLALWIKDNAIAENYKIYAGIFLSFWGVKSGLIFYFWVGLLFLMFAYFRYYRNQEKYPPVKLRSYRQYQRLLKKKQFVPNNWRELKTFRTKIDVFQSYEPDLIKLLEKAYSLAMEFRHQELTPAHVLMAALNNPEEKEKNVEAKRVTALFSRLGIHRGKLGPKLKEALEKIEAKNEDDKAALIISRELRQSLVEGYLQAGDNRRRRVGILDLVVSLAKEGKILRSVFNELKVNLKQIEDAADWLIISDRFTVKKYKYQKNREKVLRNKFNAATDAVATPILNYYCRDLTRQIQEEFTEVFAGHEKEIEKIFQAFAEKKNQIILVGPDGVGKKAVVKNLAELIVEDDVPRVLHNKRLLRLDVKKVKEEAPGINLEKKLLVIIHELNKAGNAILVIENISGEILNILSRYPAAFKMIATAEKELSAPGAHNIKINEPDESSLMRIAAGSVVKFEEKYKVFFSYSALITALRASREFLTGRALPARAVELLKKVSQKAAADYDRNITDIIVAKIVSQETGVPYTKILK